jgi:hypothetical protein
LAYFLWLVKAAENKIGLFVAVWKCHPPKISQSYFYGQEKPPLFFAAFPNHKNKLLQG